MDATDILKAKKISRTPIREKMLNIMSNKGPLTQKEIMELANFDLNRITLYRTLRKFINGGIVVRIYDDSGSEKFYLNSENTKNHIHFKCTVCGNLYSIPHKDFQFRALPKGFTIKEKKLFIKGICSKCNSAS
ncbi:MAG: Fur family transcriptional regulator [Ginsengibacter sp.]